MRISTFGMKDLQTYGDLWWRSLEHRRRIFVDEMGWDIPCNDDVEFDEYDRPDTSYIVCHEGDEIFGSIRIAPTMAKWGAYSSMIGDAINGLLPGIPHDIVDDFRPSADIFEATRFYVVATRMAKRMKAQKMIFEAAMAETERRGGDTLVSISPLSMIKLITRTSLASEQVGKTIYYDDTPHGVIATKRARVATVETFPQRKAEPVEEFEPLRISA